jgi:hypothetical protein
MAVASATGTLNITTGVATSTVAVGSLGFQPTVVIFWWNGLTAASNGTRTTSLRGIGAAVSASSFFAHANYDEDSPGTSVAKNNYASDACIIQVANDASIVGKADLQSFDAGGFTLEIQDAFPTDLLVHYWAIGGTTNAELGTFTATGVAPTTQTVNNVGNFQPDITFFFFGSQVQSGTDAMTMIGAATSASDEHIHYSGANDAVGTGASGSYNMAGECIVWHGTSPPTAPTNRADLASHNSGPGGFTINWLERTNAQVLQFLSIKGGLWTVGDLLTQTDTTTAMAESGFGHTPVGAMFISAGNAATVANATPGTHDKWSIGCATGPSARNVCQVDSRSGNTAMFVHPSSRTDAVYVNTDPAQTNHTLTGLMDVQSFDADGITTIMDDADPAQAFAWYVAVGNVAAAGGNRRRRFFMAA